MEAAEASRKASDIMQKLVDDNPANTSFRFLLVISQNGLGRVLDRQRLGRGVQRRGEGAAAR